MDAAGDLDCGLDVTCGVVVSGCIYSYGSGGERCFVRRRWLILVRGAVLVPPQVWLEISREEVRRELESSVRLKVYTLICYNQNLFIIHVVISVQSPLF